MNYYDYIKKEHEINFDKKLNMKENIKFGLEVEFDTRHDYLFFSELLKDYSYKIVRDNTAPDMLEAVSPILSNNKETWNELENILNIIKYNKGNISWLNGGHIHYDYSILEKNDIINFLKIWYLFEEHIYSFSKGDLYFLRPIYIKYARKISHRIKNNINDINDDYYLYSFLNTLDKKYCINFKNHTKCYYNKSQTKNTYEVRIPNGSLELYTWMNNVLFFYKLFEFSRNKEIIDDLFKYGKFKNNFDNAMLLSDLIYKNENDKNNFLKQYIKKGF